MPATAAAHIVTHKSGRSFQAVLGYAAIQWRRQPVAVGGTIAAILLATVADLAMPIYAGHLIDAVAEADRDAGRAAGIAALVAMATLGVAQIVGRHLSFLGIIRVTTRMMRDAAQEAFWRVQRFATDWHANSFAGSIVRRITRGMWAIDLLNDTVVLAFIPSALVLFGSALLLGLVAGDGWARAGGRGGLSGAVDRCDPALCRPGRAAVEQMGHAYWWRAGGRHWV